MFYRKHKRVFGGVGFIADKKTGELVPMPSMTKQEFVSESDINNILKQYSKTGVLRHVRANAEQGSYMDLPDPIDYQDAMNAVIAGNRAFESLPSALRNRFANDPAKFLEFMADPANQDEAIRLGLAIDTRQPEPPPMRVEVVNPEPETVAPEAKRG